MSTFLTLRRAGSLREQLWLEGSHPTKVALRAESAALVFSCLPLLVRRMDANTMLPGRGMPLEVAFFKRYTATKHAVQDMSPWPPRGLQLAGLSLGYATDVDAADSLLGLLFSRRDAEAEAFVLRVVDCMLPAARSLADITLGEEVHFASSIHEVISIAFSLFDDGFIAALRTKWRAAAMMRMRRKRNLVNASEEVDKWAEDRKTRLRADVAKHGLKECALPSCVKREASVGQHKRCSACHSVWYCSAEHGALHWKEHKPVCRATAAALQAADDAGAGVSG